MSRTTSSLLLLALFLVFPSLLRAEITFPYTVDEKPQVLFGDSGSPIDSHLGLENYTYDYVGGYLHITFTYTHHLGAFASYPPYICNCGGPSGYVYAGDQVP